MQDAMDRLLTLLGYQVAGLPKLITPIPYDPQPTDLAQSLTQAATARPELRLAALGIENRYAAIRLARSSARPRLDVFGSVGMPLEGGISTDWTAGVEAQMPLASRALRDDVRQAEWQLPVSLQQLEALREDIAAEVRSQVRAAEAARAKVEIAVVGVEVARQSLRAAQRMVEEGLSTNRDVLDAQDELTSSESSVVTSKISYHLAQIRLRQAVGEDLAKALLAAEEAVGATAPTGEANTP
jgi:protease secretion system outer membrane protein